MSTPLNPVDRMDPGDTQIDIPFNNNARRIDVLSGPIESGTTTAQPTLSSPGDDGKMWIIPGSATGSQWASFTEDSIAIFYGGTFTEVLPTDGLKKYVVDEDADWQFKTASGWAVSAGGGGSTIGKQAIYISAAAMRPSLSGGCQALNTIASAANQPDIVTLDFDPTTQEYAQFSIVMPKKWNEGTITFVPQWSHAATTTNFGVAWNLQAVAVGNDDAIAANFGTAQVSVDTGGTTNDQYMGPESSAITVAGTPGVEEMVFFRVSRVTGDAGDNMAIDARLHGVTVYVTTDADTDA